MATTTNKQRTLTHLLGFNGHGGESRSRTATVAEAEPLPVLEQVMFALCRENATQDQAEQAYANLKSRFFDWNEIRVSTVRELEEAMAGLSDTENRAQRMIAFLQEVFEEHFSYDLEGLQKKGVKQAAKKITSYGAANEFVGAWVTQRSLGGHAIPVDAASLRCARRLGLIEGNTDNYETARAALEHLIPKAKGTHFSDAISQVAEEYCREKDPNCRQCPLRGDCPTAQKVASEHQAATKSRSAKPR
ncbi:MAG: endonuclease III domain-containing protein [Gemmataceae bacterium]